MESLNLLFESKLLESSQKRKYQKVSLLESIEAFGYDLQSVLQVKLTELKTTEAFLENLLVEKVRAVKSNYQDSDPFTLWFLTRFLTLRTAVSLAKIKNEKRNILRALKLCQRGSDKGWQERLERAREHPLLDLFPGQMKKSGKSYRGLCPFHKEKTPSFFIYPEQNRYKCYGLCQASGDSLAFLMRLDGLDFKTAVGRLS